MAQPYYVYPNGNQNGGYGGFYPTQMPNYVNPYQAQPQQFQNAQNQPMNGYGQQQGQLYQQQQNQPVQPNFNPQQWQPQPQAQQPQFQPQVENNGQQSTPIKDIRFVTSTEAEKFIVAPNSNVLLLDIPNGLAYFKSTDNIGQSFTECYKFTKISLNGAPIENATPKPVDPTPQPVPQIDLSPYVKKQDIADFLSANSFVTTEQYNALKDEVNSLKKQITTSGRKQQQKEENA